MAGNYPLTIILGMLDNTGPGFGKASSRLGKFAEKAGRIGKTMTANLTMPIAGVATHAVRAFAEFEKGMSNVSTLVDTSTESMADMGKMVQKIGARTPVEMSQLTSALFDVRSAGIGADDAMSVLEKSAQLGTAGLGTTAQAARLAAGAINAWNLKGEDADRVYNTIFQTTKNGITTIAGLEQGFGAVAGKMASAGIGVEDYMASIAALTTTTLPASQAHTQMRAAVDGLEKSGKKTGKVFRKLGVKDFKELLAREGNVTEAFRKIADAAGDESGALKDLIGSSEGAAAVTALLGKQGDKQIATFEEMQKKSEGLTDVQIAFNKQNETSAAQWQRTKNQLTSAAISMGTVLAPALTKISQKVSELAAWFSGLDDDTKETIAKFAFFVAAAGPVVMMVGKITTGIRMLSLALGAGPLGLLVGGLLAIRALTGDSFSTIFNDAIAFWKENLGKVFLWIEDKIKQITQVVGDAVAYLKGEETSADKDRQDIRNEIIRTETEATFGRKRVAGQNRETAIDAKFEALLAKKDREGAFNFNATQAPAGAVDGRMVLEFVNPPPGIRVKSKQQLEAVDVKMGPQAGF